MKQWIVRLLVLSGIVVLSACATPLREDQRSAIKTVGIVNNFPDRPNFITIGTTVFTNKVNEVTVPGLKDQVTEQLVALLRTRGYEAEAATSPEPKDNYDIVLELMPRDVYNVPILFGYGFFQRFLLGGSMMRNSYVALNLVPTIKGRGTCLACYEFVQSPLPFETMPDNWAALSEADQKVYLESLRKDIDTAMTRLLDKAGL